MCTPTLFGRTTAKVLEPTVPVKRAVFHEITQEALVKAFEVRCLSLCAMSCLSPFSLLLPSFPATVFKNVGA